MSVVKKGLAALTAAAVFGLSGAVFCAQAVELMEPYEGMPLDSYTGNPIDGQSAQQSMIAGRSWYDNATGYHVFAVGQETGSLQSSVPDGIVTTDGVHLASVGANGLTLYRNGEAVPEEEWSNLTEVGQYVVNRVSNSVTTRVMGFTIVSDYTGMLYNYELPTDCATTRLVLDGEPQAIGHSSIDFSREGKYTIAYVCNTTGEEYTLDVTIDHTPPELIFEGLDENNVATGPVTVTPTEEGCSVGAMRNDEPYTYRETFTEAGHYVVQVWDRAGNSTAYAFTIKMYMNISAGGFLLIVLLSLGILIGYLVRCRTKMRVR